MPRSLTLLQFCQWSHKRKRRCVVGSTTKFVHNWHNYLTKIGNLGNCGGWYRGANFLFPSHNRKNFGGHYASKNQSAGHEDGKVEIIKGGSNSPFQFGYSWKTLIGEVEHRFGCFCGKCSKITTERIQRCIYMDVQGPKRHSTSPSVAPNCVQYQHLYITSSMVSNKSELCHSG